MNKFVNAEDVKDLINGLDSLPWEDEVEDMVDSLIVTDVAEIKHGKWIECFNELNKYCSVCEKLIGTIYHKPNFCENCGAKMDGE